MPIFPEPWQKDKLKIKETVSKKIYNAMLAVNLKKYREMTKTMAWRQLNDIIIEELLGTASEESEESGKKKRKLKSDRLKEAYKKKNDMLREYGFSDFAFRSQAVQMSKHYSCHISSNMANIGIGAPQWVAFQKLFFGDGEEVHFKKYNDTMSIASDGKSGMILKYINGEYCIITRAGSKKMMLPIMAPKTDYEKYMMKDLLTDKTLLRQIRIIRKVEKGRDKYYCQLVIAKAPFIKLDDYGYPIHQTGKGLVGIAIWRGKICAVSDKETYTAILSPDAEVFDAERKRLSAKLSQIRRENNPDNYNEDGTIKRGIIGPDGKRQRLKWNLPPAYDKTKKKLAELHRVHTVNKELTHRKIIYDILAMGDQFVFADMSFANEKPEWDEDNPLSNAEYKKKKERRRSIQENAPYSFFVKLNQKLVSRNLGEVEKRKVPEDLFWYRHDIGASDPELMNDTLIQVAGKNIDQTLYRAFLIPFLVNGTYDQEGICEAWESFLTAIDKKN